MIERDRIAELNESLGLILDSDVEALTASLDRRGSRPATEIIEALTGFSVAAPSWAVGLKDRLEDLIQSTEAVSIAYAQALLVDREQLTHAQHPNDAALGQEDLQSGFRTDVRPLVAEARRRAGGAISPLEAYRRSGYREAMVTKRGSEPVGTGL